MPLEPTPGEITQTALHFLAAGQRQLDEGDLASAAKSFDMAAGMLAYASRVLRRMVRERKRAGS